MGVTTTVLFTTTRDTSSIPWLLALLGVVFVVVVGLVWSRRVARDEWVIEEDVENV